MTGGAEGVGSLLSKSAAQLSSAYRANECSPVDVIHALRAAIEQDVRGINAFCHLDWPAALSAAQESERRYRSGQVLGRLDGVPVSIKDLVNVAGWPTRRGSLATSDFPPAAVDAPAVAQLRAAGAIVFGKTTTTEFGWTIGSENPYSGVTRNPLDPERSAGGSSSGASAQVAAGWGPIALGSDAGGSVRIPAAFCGLVGFKPTFGGIPLAPSSAFAEYAHLGVLTRSVDDCYAAMSPFAPDPLDPSSLFPRVDVSVERPLRIGWSSVLGSRVQPDPLVARAFGQTIGKLAEAGYDLEEVSLGLEDASESMWTVWCSRIFESFQAWPESRRVLLSDELRDAYEAGRALDMAALAASRTRLREMATTLAGLFCRIDMLLTPAAPSVAPGLDKERAASGRRDFNWFDVNGYAYPFNVSQQPALSLPMGMAEHGLPCGLQIAGRGYHDGQVLKFGSVAEGLLKSWT